ncbi:formylglycine-generating enzyme family protein [Treponema sp. R80B11-R83G3]
MSQLENLVIDKIKNSMTVFPIVITGKTKSVNESLLRRLTSNGKRYNLNKDDLNILLDMIKVDIDNKIPVALHIMLDHSGSMQDTVSGVTQNLTFILQEIWRYKVTKKEAPLNEFLNDFFTDMPTALYEIGEPESSFEILHQVFLTEYKIMSDLVTQKFYDIYLKETGKENPAKILNPDSPQTNVSYNQAADEFVKFLNKKYNTTGFFIPKEEHTEAFYKTYPNKILANRDHKVLEITSSFFGEYELEQTIDPTGPYEGTDRVVKGYFDDHSRFRPALRGRIDPETPSPLVGIRLAFRKQ